MTLAMSGYRECPSCRSMWVERTFIPDDPQTLRTGDGVVPFMEMPGRIEVACAQGHRFRIAEAAWSLDYGLSYNGLTPL